MSAAGLSAGTLQPATAVAALNEAVEAAQRAFELGRQADPDRRAGWLEAIAAGLE
jgi:acyl-CoA reductase-like NAD-dependent aldehyde dehydrogenase